MNRKWLGQLMTINSEFLLGLSILAVCSVISFVVSNQGLALYLYNLPTLFAGYYFGRARALQVAIASLLGIGCLSVMISGAQLGKWSHRLPHTLGRWEVLP